MPAAFGALGAKSAGGTTALSVPYPAGITAGQLLVLYRVVWLSSATCTVPAGWTSAVDGTGGTGTTASNHTTKIHIDYKIAVGTESGNLATAQAGSPSGAVGVMARYTLSAGETWDIETIAGRSSDTSHGANRGGAATTGSTTSVSGDMMLVGASVDVSTALTITGPIINIGAIGGLALTRRTSGAGVTTGLAGNVEVFDRALTDTRNGTIEFGFTTATTQCGAGGMLRIRAVSAAVPAEASAALDYSFNLGAAVQHPPNRVSAALGWTANLSAVASRQSRISAGLGWTANLSAAAATQRKAAAALGWSADLSAVASVRRSVAAALSWSADLTASTVAEHNVSASIFHIWQLTAAGSTDPRATAGLDYSFELAAAAETERAAAADLDYSFDLHAALAAPHAAQAALDWSAGLSVSTETEHAATAALDYSFELTAVGNTPVPGQQEASAALDFRFELTATSSRDSETTAVLPWSAELAAVVYRLPAAAAAVEHRWELTAAAEQPDIPIPETAAALDHGWTLTAHISQDSELRAALDHIWLLAVVTEKRRLPAVVTAGLGADRRTAALGNPSRASAGTDPRSSTLGADTHTGRTGKP